MNCKNEFLSTTSKRKVLCASLIKGDGFKYNDNEDSLFFNLLVDYTEKDYNNFLSEIDFDYDDGFGSQEVFGTIWYKDGTWEERFEYDGAERWTYKSCPQIPENLRRQ